MQMLAVIRGPCLAEGLDTDYAVRSIVAEPVGETRTTDYGLGKDRGETFLNRAA
jgi:hypothetical protein